MGGFRFINFMLVHIHYIDTYIEDTLLSVSHSRNNTSRHDQYYISFVIWMTIEIIVNIHKLHMCTNIHTTSFMFMRFARLPGYHIIADLLTFICVVSCRHQLGFHCWCTSCVAQTLRFATLLKVLTDSFIPNIIIWRYSMLYPSNMIHHRALSVRIS